MAKATQVHAKHEPLQIDTACASGICLQCKKPYEAPYGRHGNSGTCSSACEREYSAQERTELLLGNQHASDSRRRPAPQTL